MIYYKLTSLVEQEKKLLFFSVDINIYIFFVDFCDLKMFPKGKGISSNITGGQLEFAFYQISVQWV